MTLLNEKSLAVYEGNGSATEFPFDFLIPPDAIEVALLFAGAETPLLESEYSVVGLGQEAGGTVTYNPAGGPLPTGQRLVIRRVLPYTQPIDIGNQQRFFASVFETAMNRATMQLQQLNNKIKQAVVAPLDTDVSTFFTDVISARTQAQQAKSDAETAAENAEGFAEAASGSAVASASSAVIAGEKVTEAEAQVQLSSEFANNPEDVPVEPGLFSSFHWMKKAEGFTGPNFLRRDGGNAMTAPLDFGAQKAVNLAVGTEPTDGVTVGQVDTKISVSVAAAVTAVNVRLTGNTTTRQTVLSGPVDANGRADFLDAGTGLQVVTAGLDVDPLQISFGDGFTNGEQRNFGVQIDTALTWDSLPNNEDEIFLFIRVLPDGTVETFHSLLAPVYAQARPSAPATGQTFYPTDHRHRMEVWDGTVWDSDNLNICVGQCSTSGGTVVDVRSYAYGGQWYGEETNLQTTVTRNINIGAPNLVRQGFICVTADAHFSAGEVLNIESWSASTSSAAGWNIATCADHFSLTFIRLSGALFRLPTRDGSANGTYTADVANFKRYARVERAF